MHTEHLNIGLNRTDDKTMNASDVAYLIAAKLPWLRFTTSGPFASQTEPTVVVTLRYPVNDATITELCELLAQDCIARFNAVHGDTLVIDGTFPGSVFDPDILARAGVVYAYLYWPSVGNGFVVTSRLGSVTPGAFPWSADRFRLLDGTFLALSRTVAPEAAPDGLAVSVAHVLPWQRVTDIIVVAFETPYGDWINRADNANPAVREGEEADSIWYANPLYWQRGFSAEIEHEDPDGRALPPKSFCLNRDTIARGLAVMAKYCPEQFADIVRESDDAGTADTFLQCCVFPDYVEKHGDVIFG